MTNIVIALYCLTPRGVTLDALEIFFRVPCSAFHSLKFVFVSVEIIPGPAKLRPARCSFAWRIFSCFQSTPAEMARWLSKPNM